MQIPFVINLLGWTGAAMLLAAFVFVSFGKIKATAANYRLLNLVGSALLVANTFYLQAYPSAALNAVWAIVAVLAIIKTKKDAENKN